MVGGKQIAADDESNKKRVDALANAFSWWARENPDSFNHYAPDMLRQGVGRAVGHDPRVSRELERWLTECENWDFGLVELIEHESDEELEEPPKLNKNRYKGTKRQWLDCLDDKFAADQSDKSGDFRRWDRHIRDQFIVLGLVSRYPEGSTQGHIARILGINLRETASRKYAANVVRAAKIALTRMALKHGLDDGLFAAAVGNRLNRRHSFSNESIRELTWRWVQNHPARVLIPDE